MTNTHYYLSIVLLLIINGCLGKSIHHYSRSGAAARLTPLSSFEELVKKWGEHTSKNVNGGSVKIDLNADDEEMRKQGMKIEYKLDEIELGDYDKGTPTVRLEGNDENKSDQEITTTISLEGKKSFEATSRITAGIKVGAKAKFGVPDIGEGEISIEVSLEEEETRSESHATTISKKTEIKIPPHSRVKNTLEVSELSQKVPFTGKLFVSGNAGVYFDNKVCNVFGDGCDGHHFKWFPTAKQIVEWAIEDGYQKWHVEGDKAWLDIEGESNVTVFSYTQQTGETEPI